MLKGSLCLVAMAVAGNVSAQEFISIGVDADADVPSGVQAHGWDYVAKENVETSVEAPNEEFEHKGVVVVSYTIGRAPLSGAAQFNPETLTVTISNDYER